MILKCILSLIFFLASENANAKNCIELKNSILDHDSYEYLKSKIIKDSDICFENIPGGKAILLKKFSRLINGKNIHIQGYCSSLCAALSLSVDNLILHNKKAEYPSFMIIHPSFDSETKEWHPTSLDYIDYYYDRLKIIDKKYIIQALTYKNYGINGLFISSAPLPQFAPSKSLVHLCEDFPKKCISLDIFNLKKMEITVVND